MTPNLVEIFLICYINLLLLQSKLILIKLMTEIKQMFHVFQLFGNIRFD